MKKGLFSLVVVAILMCGFFYLNSTIVEGNPVGPKIEVGRTLSPEPETADEHEVSRRLISISQKAVVSRGVPGVPQTRDGMSLQAEPFIAASIDEQRWLDRNGYPNSEQLRVYSSLPDSSLAKAANEGDSVAAVMLANRGLIQGEPGAGEELLALAAAGSGYALQVHAAFLAGSSRGNPREAWAISRVEEMRGNMRLALARDAMFPQPLSQSERLQGDARALELFAMLRRLRVEVNGSDEGWVDPRPYY